MNRAHGGHRGRRLILGMLILSARSVPILASGRGKALAFAADVGMATALAGCGPKSGQIRQIKRPQGDVAGRTEGPRAVTADVQAGIERHIEERSRADGRYFLLPFKQRVLRLKLVRIHVEYLASLGPLRNFACVDLVDTDGEVYDVDFFMEGPPHDMKVTETTVHKINGKPLYAWAQKEDRTWHRVSVDEASAELQGVIHERDAFEFTYRVDLPTLTSMMRVVPRAVRFLGEVWPKEDGP